MSSLGKGLHFNSPIEDIIEDARQSDIPEEALPELRRMIEKLRFQIQTEFDQCKRAVIPVFASHGIDIESANEEVQKAIHSTIMIYDKVVGVLVAGHAYAHETGEHEAFQEALGKHAVLGEVFNQLITYECDKHSSDGPRIKGEIIDGPETP